MHIVHQLVVLVPPTIEAVLPSFRHAQELGLVGLSRHMERPIEARVGSSVELECRAEGIPTPQIRWRRPAVSKKLCFLKCYNNSWYYYMDISNLMMRMIITIYNVICSSNSNAN